VTDQPPHRPGYWRENIDPEISKWFDDLLAKYPGVHRSKRAALHDVLRRGMMAFMDSGLVPQSASSGTPGSAATLVPSAAPPALSGDAAEAVDSDRPPRQRKERRIPRARAHEPPAAGPAVDADVARGKAGPEVRAPVRGDVPPPARGTEGDEPPATPTAGAPVPAGSTWTCPDCRATMPKERKGWHGPDCPGRRPAVTVERTIAHRRGQAAGVPPSSEAAGPAATAGPDPAIVEYVRSKLDGARLDAKMRERLEHNPRAWLVGMVQLGARDRGVLEPSDQEAQEWIRSTLAREIPAVGKLLAQEIETTAAAADAKPTPPSTWTCPMCGVTMPSEDRTWHGPMCEGRPVVARVARPMKEDLGFEAPKVKCARCGELVETTASARDAHFKTCPPDPPESDGDRLVEDVRARISAQGPAAEPLDPELERDLQLALVQQVAAAKGIVLEGDQAAEVLERARASGGRGPREGI